MAELNLIKHTIPKGWRERNLQVEGEYETIEINYNSSDILVLAKGESDELRNILEFLGKGYYLLN